MNNDGPSANQRTDESPPRQRARPGDQPDPVVERAFDYLLNTLFGRPHQDTPPTPHRLDEDAHISDMPPVEPLSTPASSAQATTNSSTRPSSVSMDIDPISNSPLQPSPSTINIPETAPSSSQRVAGDTRMVAREARNDQLDSTDAADNDMPTLLDASDSEDDDADDVEMMVRDSTGDDVPRGSGHTSDTEDEIIHEFADMPALESVRRPRQIGRAHV